MKFTIIYYARTCISTAKLYWCRVRDAVYRTLEHLNVFTSFIIKCFVFLGCCYSKPLLVPGGRAFVWPAIQNVQRISLNTMTLQVESPTVYTSQGVPISVTGIAQVTHLLQLLFTFSLSQNLEKQVAAKSTSPTLQGASFSGVLINISFIAVNHNTYWPLIRLLSNLYFYIEDLNKSSSLSTPKRTRCGDICK